MGNMLVMITDGMVGPCGLSLFGDSEHSDYEVTGAHPLTSPGVSSVSMLQHTVHFPFSIFNLTQNS